MIVSFTGAESTGKTTLVDQLDFGLHKVTSLTRKVPKELRGTHAGQDRILSNYLAELSLLAPQGFICDRTLFDVCAYSKVAGVWSDAEIDKVLRLYPYTSFYPDYLFYLPIEFPMVQDGGRPEGIREEIDKYIRQYVETYAPQYYTLKGSIPQRLEEAQRIVRK